MESEILGKDTNNALIQLNKYDTFHIKNSEI